MEKMKSKNKTKFDKAMALQIPGTKPLEPIVRKKPPPAGYVRKSVEPNGGGELFETLLTTSTEIFKLVSEAGRNVVSMSTPITLMVEEKECNMERLAELGIETKKMGNQFILETSGIVDTGADISCTTDEVRDALGRALSQMLMEELQEWVVFSGARRRTSYV